MKSRPPGYEQAVSIDLSKSPVLAVVLTLAGFGLFLLLGWLGLRLLTILRPDVQSLTLRVSGLGSGLLFLAGLIVLIALTVTLHELVHGVFFLALHWRAPQIGLEMAVRLCLSSGLVLASQPASGGGCRSSATDYGCRTNIVNLRARASAAGHLICDCGKRGRVDRRCGRPHLVAISAPRSVSARYGGRDPCL